MTHTTRSEVTRADVDPNYSAKYTYNSGSGYPGAGKLSEYEDEETGLTDMVAYNAHSQPAGIGCWQWLVDDYLLYNIGNHVFTWNGTRLAKLASDLPESGLTGSLSYGYNGDGHPCFVHLKGRDDGEVVDLFIGLVTDSQGSVIGLLDDQGHRFATYRYDVEGKSTAETQATDLISGELAEKIAKSQVLRYHGYPYSAPLKLYWEGDWFDPETGKWVWPGASSGFEWSADAWWDGTLTLSEYTAAWGQGVADTGMVDPIGSLGAAYIEYKYVQPWAEKNPGKYAGVMIAYALAPGPGGEVRMGADLIKSERGLTSLYDGFRAYKESQKLTKGFRGLIQAHHLIEVRFREVWGGNPKEWLAIVVSRDEHMMFTKRWKDAINWGEGTANATREKIEEAAREVYFDRPDILRALDL